MSFSLDSTGQGPFGGAVEALVRNGPDLEEIQTDVSLLFVSHMSSVGLILMTSIGARISFPLRRGESTTTPFAMAFQ
jgi:hypothetical protein